MSELQKTCCSAFEQLGTYVKNTIEAVLLQEKIPTSTIQMRVKARESFLRKSSMYKETGPTEDITHPVAILVVTLRESDARRLLWVMGEALELPTQPPPDILKVFWVDRVGYRSL